VFFIAGDQPSLKLRRGREAGNENSLPSRKLLQDRSAARASV